MSRVYVGDGIIVTGPFSPVSRERTDRDRELERQAYEQETTDE